jgi:hypothetical protein
MPAKRTASRRSLGSDLKKVDTAPIKRAHYRELPALTEEMIARGEIRRAGRPRAQNPRVQLTIRLPTGTRRFPTREHIGGQPDRQLHAWVLGTRTPRATDLTASDHLLRQRRQLPVVRALDGRGVNFLQV